MPFPNYKKIISSSTHLSKLSLIFKAMSMPMDARPSLFRNPPHNPTNHSQLIKEHTSMTIPTTALGILKFYGDKVKELAQEQNNEKPPESSQHVIISNDVPSATNVIKLARAKLVKLNSKVTDVFYIIAACFGDIPYEDFEDLEIALILQAAAEKIAQKKFPCARKLLSLCNHSAFKRGTPVQRTVFYFAKALNERIDREFSTSFAKALELSQQHKKPLDVRQTQISLDPATIAHQQKFSVVAINQFTGIQVILDNVSSAKKIHLIDFRIRNGWQWTILMQALAVRKECPVELVKITAIGTCKKMLDKTGRWLSSFAESMKLPFSFDHVVSELNEVREDMLKIEADETVAIYSSVCLFSLIAFPSQLESLISVIKKLRPCVMVVNEVNQTKDSSNFTERFTNTLFYVSALFDCASVCGSNDSYRILAEEVHLWGLIQNSVVAEGTDRVFRHEEVSFWRALFAKFGIVETQISSAAICQAKLMVGCSPGKSFYNLGMDGKCMVLGWKGTTLEFLSAWKFNHDKK